MLTPQLVHPEIAAAIDGAVAGRWRDQIAA